MANRKTSAGPASDSATGTRSPRNSRGKPASSPTGDQELDQLWNTFLEAPALCTEAETYAAEDQFEGDGAFRRVVIASAKFSGKELSTKASEDPEFAEVLAMTVHAADYWLERCKLMNGLIKSQQARARMALCCFGGDQDELMERASVRLFSDEGEAA